MYRFVRYQPHKKFPDLQGWYLVLKPTDLETLMKLHEGVAHFYFVKFGSGGSNAREGVALGINPIQMAAKWMEAVGEAQMRGETLVVNKVGGWCPLNEDQVHSEKQSERLAWPDYYEDEVITISKYELPEARHYYLTSNKERVFSPPKHNTYEAAQQMAHRYTGNVQTKGFD
jgi:hypothetical protein